MTPTVFPFHLTGYTDDRYINFSSTRFTLQRTKLFLIHGTDELTGKKGIIGLHLHIGGRQYKTYKFCFYTEKKYRF